MIYIEEKTVQLLEMDHLVSCLIPQVLIKFQNIGGHPHILLKYENKAALYLRPEVSFGVCVYIYIYICVCIWSVCVYICVLAYE